MEYHWKKNYLATCCVTLGLIHTFLGMPDGLEASMSVDWHLQWGFKSPHGHIGFFFNDVPWQINDIAKYN